jgi:hypothetical protein
MKVLAIVLGIRNIILLVILVHSAMCVVAKRGAVRESSREIGIVATEASESVLVETVVI